MKITLNSSQYSFNPSTNKVFFSPMSGLFKPERLLAVVNVTTGKLIYAVASIDQGFGGSFSTTSFTNDTLTYLSSNTGQSASDILECLYDDENYSQNVNGSVSVTGPVGVVGSLGSSGSLPTAIHDGSGTYPILSTPDPMTGRDGLDINLQSSSFAGEINQPLPIPYQNQAISVGFINSGNLMSPAIDPVSSQLIVDATQSGNVPVAINASSLLPVEIQSTLFPVDVNIASSGTTVPVSIAATVPVSIAATVPVSAASLPLPSGAATETTLSGMSAKLPASLGAKTIANSMAVNIASDQVIPVSQAEVYTTGASTLALNNNIFLASAGANSTDAQGYKSGSVQIVTAATTGALIFEHSNDNINFQPMPVFRTDSASPNAIVAAITPTASSFVYHFPIKQRYIRCRISTVLNSNAQSFLRLSQESWAPIVPQVINATAANLNATVSGSVTVTQPTPANLNVTAAVTGATLGSSANTDIASAAITTTQTSANFSQVNTQACSFAVYVTAISGAGAAMDVAVQETMDGTNYYTIYQFERITATGQFYSPCIKLSGSGVRYIRTISGTTPSVTNSVVRIARQGQAETIRRFIDRTSLVPNTLNSNTGSFFCEGVEDYNLMVRCTSQTTPATIALEFSMDNTNWFTSTTTLSTVNGIAMAKIDNMQFKFVRATVTAAGTGIILGEVTIGGHSA